VNLRRPAINGNVTKCAAVYIWQTRNCVTLQYASTRCSTLFASDSLLDWVPYALSCEVWHQRSCLVKSQIAPISPHHLAGISEQVLPILLNLKGVTARLTGFNREFRALAFHLPACFLKLRNNSHHIRTVTGPKDSTDMFPSFVDQCKVHNLTFALSTKDLIHPVREILTVRSTVQPCSTAR
jgi:hypothetical protein